MKYCVEPVVNVRMRGDGGQCAPTSRRSCMHAAGAALKAYCLRMMTWQVMRWKVCDRTACINCALVLGLVGICACGKHTSDRKSVCNSKCL